MSKKALFFIAILTTTHIFNLGITGESAVIVIT